MSLKPAPTLLCALFGLSASLLGQNPTQQRVFRAIPVDQDERAPRATIVDEAPPQEIGYGKLVVEDQIRLINTSVFHLRCLLMRTDRYGNETLLDWHTIPAGSIGPTTNYLHKDSAGPYRYWIHATTAAEEEAKLDYVYGHLMDQGETPLIEWPSTESSDNLIVREVNVPVTSIYSDQNYKTSAPSRSYLASFREIRSSSDDSTQFSETFNLPETGMMDHLILDESSDTATTEGAILSAKQISDSLHRQIEVMRLLVELGTLPYSLGLDVDPEDDPTAVGIKIARAQNILSDGRPNPLSAGDEILSLNGRKIRSAFCLINELLRHGMDIKHGGIANPIRFEAIDSKTGRVFAGKTTYWINKEFFTQRDINIDVKDAISWGLWEGITIGFGEEISAEVLRSRTGWSRAKCQFALVQYDGALNQWHGGAVAGAEMATLLFSLPRAILSKASTRAFRNFSKSKLGVITYESGELAILTIKEREALTTDKEIRDQLKLTIPIAASFPAISAGFRVLKK